MDVKRITLLLTVGLLTASCGVTSSSDQPATTSVDVASAPSADERFAVESIDLEIRMRSGIVGYDASQEYPQTATLSLPSGLDGSQPVVVLLHGAGAMSRHSLNPMAEEATAMGVPVLNASWLASHANPVKSAADAVCAVAYAHRNAASWGADPEKIIVMGHSGGGHVGMLAALAPEAFPECHAAADAHVWAYVGLAGDPASVAPGGNSRRYWKDDPTVMAVMDAYTHIGGNPDLISRFVHGTRDTIVELDLTRDFHKALAAAGYESSFIAVQGATHSDPRNPGTEAGMSSVGVLEELISLAIS